MLDIRTRESLIDALGETVPRDSCITRNCTGKGWKAELGGTCRALFSSSQRSDLSVQQERETVSTAWCVQGSALRSNIHI